MRRTGRRSSISSASASPVCWRSRTTDMRNEAPLVGLDETHDGEDDEGMDLFELLALLREHLTLLIVAPLLAGFAALGITYLIKPTFTATTVFLPPQQQQSAAASVLAQLGPLAGLAGAAGAIRTPADQYVALMQSVTVADRLIDQFKLMQEYDQEYRMEARKELAKNVRISVGKKDGLITL